MAGSAGARALIAGAGIGGLTAANALRRAGWDIAVFERAPELWEVGAGIQVFVHAVAALDRLGLGAAVAERGEPAEVYEFHSWKKGPLASIPIGAIARQHSKPAPVFLRRQELIKVLGEPVAGAIRFGSECVGFEQDAAGVILRLAGGGEERGALLVAADGTSSALRGTMLPQVEPLPSGLQCVRGITEPAEPLVPHGVYRMTIGPGRRLGATGTPGWTDWYVVAKDSLGDGAGGLKDRSLRLIDGFPDDAVRLVQATPEEAMFPYEIKPLPALERWVSGRVTLLGDAAHATSPDLGQGASQAVRDAMALAEALAGAGDVELALKTYERERKPLVAEYMTRVKRIGGPMNWTNPIVWRLRDQAMKRVMPRALARELHRELAAS
jgi:2-polyprenyl-6-methoxyphenol hydroxylase-like FAD-dependent oxidoreductase